jgi:hypothetical protein
MRDKIKLLMCAVRYFEKNLKTSSANVPDAITSVYANYRRQASDKRWFSTVFSSFKESMLAGVKSNVWLSEQFKQLGIHQVNDWMPARSMLA